MLTRSGVVLNERVAATLEIESDVNDPMAVFLTLALIALLASSTWSGDDLLVTARALAMAALFRRVVSLDTGGGVLALFPLMAGTPQAGVLFNIAFVVVLVFLVTQGTTIALVARRLGVALPNPKDERHMRAVFGDFSLDPNTPVGDICQFYGLPMPAQAAIPLGDWMAAELNRPPVVGDCVHHASASFGVHELQGDQISRVGLGL